MTHYQADSSPLNLRARGLMGYLLRHSIQGVTHLSVAQVVRKVPEGTDAVTNALRELERHGFLTRDRARTDAGKLGEAIWILREDNEDELLLEPVAEGQPYPR